MSAWHPFDPRYALIKGLFVFVVSLALIWGLGLHLTR